MSDARKLNKTMKTKYTLLFLLILALPGCNKDDGSAVAVEGLRGKWAPLHDDWQTDRYIEFEKGFLSTWKMDYSYIARDGKIWNWSQGDTLTLISRQPYSFSGGNLYAGRHHLGKCTVRNDTLLLEGQKYMRILQMAEANFTHFVFGEGLDPLSPKLTTDKRAKALTLPCCMADSVPMVTEVRLGTLSKRLDDLRFIPASDPGQKDSLTLHIDENRTEKILTESLYIYHPATGMVTLQIIQSN